MINTNLKYIAVIFLLTFLLYNSCSTIEKDCLCSEEYRFYMVTVIDTLGVPVDSLTTVIKDKDGNNLNVQQDYHPFGAGKYTVLNDSFREVFCNCGTSQKIYFSAIDGSRTAYGEFLFNTDECKCHINKVSGPDTLILK